MKRYVLSSSDFRLLKGVHLEELECPFILDDETCSIEIDDLRSLLILLNEEIVCFGLTPDQQEVTKHGYDLYGLYDELYAQK